MREKKVNDVATTGFCRRVVQSMSHSCVTFVLARILIFQILRHILHFVSSSASQCRQSHIPIDKRLCRSVNNTKRPIA